ncbi:MAG: HD domain-containing protein [Candidatus Aureabacteria bacterium]|nr:HD domain-containing protein [Candidatus Auribacterota bacterium]
MGGGGIIIQKEILNKQGRLTDEEWKIIHDHPMISEDILKPVVFDKEMLDIVRSHHERYDGIGYPDKMDGKSINIFAQIIAVADSYDAMTSARAYRPALSKGDAIEELKKYSGTQFNPRVVEAFVAIPTREPHA